MPALALGALLATTTVVVLGLVLLAARWRHDRRVRPASEPPAPVDDALHAAICAYLVRTGGPALAARYIGDCQTARWPEDIGKSCAVARRRADGLVHATIRHIDGDAIIATVLFAPANGGWTPIATWP
jgi:hypothetical protein